MTTNDRLRAWTSLANPPAVTVPNASIALTAYRESNDGASYDLRLTIHTEPPFVIGDVLTFHHDIDPDGRTLRVAIETTDGVTEYLNESTAESPVLEQLWAEFGTVGPEGSPGFADDEVPLAPVRGVVEIRIHQKSESAATTGLTIDWPYGGIHGATLRAGDIYGQSDSELAHIGSLREGSNVQMPTEAFADMNWYAYAPIDLSDAWVTRIANPATAHGEPNTWTWPQPTTTVRVPDACITVSAAHLIKDQVNSTFIRLDIDINPPFRLGDITPWPTENLSTGQTIQIRIDLPDGRSEYVDTTDDGAGLLSLVNSAFWTMEPAPTEGDDAQPSSVSGHITLHLHAAPTPGTTLTIEWPAGGLQATSIDVPPLLTR